MNRIRTSLLLAAVALSFIPHLAAQNIKASVGGVIVDPQGAGVPAALVTLRSLQTELAFTTVSDAAGRFHKPALDPGFYRLEVAKEGFAPYRSARFELGLGDSYRLDAHLTIGEFSTTVEVTADLLKVLQVDDTKQSRNFNAAEMNDLPNAGNGFAGRNFYVQALTTPGVSYSPLAHRPFAVSGQRPRNNNYMIDSVQVNDPSSGFIAGRGKTEQVVSQEAVQGMEVITHNYKAEYGRNSGSIVSLVSKQGSNDFHGSAYWYHLNSALSARNFFESAKAKNRTNLAGFTAGGPVKPNRAFFFGNYEINNFRGDRVTNFRSLTPKQRAQAVPAVQPLVDLYPLSPTASPVFATGIPAPTDQITYMIRADVALTDRQNLMIRNNFTNNDSDIKNLAGFVGHHVVTKRRTQSFTAHHTYAFSPAALNEFRAGYMRFTSFDDMIDPLAIGDPAINGEIGFMIVPGLSPGGALSFMGAQRAVNVFSLSDDVSWTLGSHTLKMGTSARQNRIDGGTVNNSFAGTIFFPNVNEFLAGRPLSYSRNVGNPLIGLRRNEWDAYTQDDWRISQRLTLNLGLRYELYSSPSEMHGRIAEDVRFPTDRNNFAPRLGLAWNVADKTVVRAGWGIFYNALEMSFVGLTAFNPPGIVTLSAFRPQMPDLLARASQAIPSGVTIPDQGSRTPYAQHYNVALERELWNRQTTLTAGYVGTSGTKLARTRLPNGGANMTQGLRPDQTAGMVNRLETSGTSSYNALQVGLNQRLSGFTFKAAYTHSKFMDDVSELADTNTGHDREILAFDEGNLNLDRALSDFDIPHSLSFSYIYRVPWMSRNRWLGGWSVSGITTMQAGRPYTLYSGTDNLTGANNNRIFDVTGTLRRDNSNPRPVQVIGGLDTALLLEPDPGQLGSIGRNTERRDSLYNWNVGIHKELAVSERLSVQIRGEMFNVFNVTNFSEVDNTLSVQRNQAGQPIGFNQNFGKYIEAFAPRSAQLTLRVVF
ncbi:MAG TPA: TonB-dependent receptor [Bryobacterales bacterium]|nr:TonB-dependent receptor [Bryobacterales bacterium]